MTADYPDFVTDPRPVVYCPVCGQRLRVEGLNNDLPPHEQIMALVARAARECSRSRLNLHGGTVIVA